MKSTIIYILLSVLSINVAMSQSTKDSITIHQMNGRLDSLQTKMLEDQIKSNYELKQSLSSFRDYNRVSQFMTGLGIAFAAIYAITYNHPSEDTRPLPYVALGCVVIGQAYYIDSFKFLNFNKKDSKKSKAKSIE
jgi:hypothetical protein